MINKIFEEESYTLDNYIYFIKKQNLQQPKHQSEEIEPDYIQKIQYFTERKRKMSAQLSLFSWLVKDKLPQHSLLLSLDKQLILNIYSYLRISEVFLISSVCSYFYSCYKHLWINQKYFEIFQTDKFTSQELNKIIQKSKHSHIKQLKQIYLGKNIKKNREKIKMRVTENTNIKNSMLQMFCISPKIKTGTVFIMDSHIQNIVNLSFKGLKCIELNRCPYIRNFTPISLCIELQKFTISYNEFVTTQELSSIFKRCLKLQKLQISQCKNLDENIFKLIKTAENLEALTIKKFKQPFMNLALLCSCQKLTYLNIDDSLITDNQLIKAVQEIKSLKKVSIQGCALLTNISADLFLGKLSKKDCQLEQILISRINTIDPSKIEQIEQRIYQNKLWKQSNTQLTIKQ